MPLSLIVTFNFFIHTDGVKDRFLLYWDTSYINSYDIPVPVNYMYTLVQAFVWSCVNLYDPSFPGQLLDPSSTVIPGLTSVSGCHHSTVSLCCRPGSFSPHLHNQLQNLKKGKNSNVTACARVLNNALYSAHQVFNSDLFSSASGQHCQVVAAPYTQLD